MPRPTSTTTWADWHYYSVPYRLTQQLIEVRLAVRTVELFHKGRRVAAHPRSRIKGGFTTDPAHRPKAHEKHLDWSPGRLISWAGTVGVQCALAVSRILDRKKRRRRAQSPSTTTSEGKPTTRPGRCPLPETTGWIGWPPAIWGTRSCGGSSATTTTSSSRWSSRWARCCAYLGGTREYAAHWVTCSGRLPRAVSKSAWIKVCDSMPTASKKSCSMVAASF